jgi:hypothetical protein
MLKILFKTFLFVFPITSHSVELSDNEHKSYAQACYKEVKTVLYCNKATVVPSKTFSYYNSEVLNMHDDGANISTLIKSSFQCKGGDSKGWSKSITEEHEKQYKCIFLNTERGGINQPELLIQLDNKRKTPNKIYAKTVTKPTNNDCIFTGSKLKSLIPEYKVEYDIVRKTSEVYSEVYVADSCWVRGMFGMGFVSKNYPNFWTPKNPLDFLFL